MAAPTDPEPTAAEQRRRDRQQAREETYERVTGRPFRIIEISDAQGIRALAHEARQQVIEVLFAQERPFTSTELATVTGLTPSAMSYHLRALEKWGVVERVDDAGDARNRPWQAAGTTIRIRSEGEAGRAAADLWTEKAWDAWRARVQHQRTLPKKEANRFVGLGQGQLWLTDEQLERFTEIYETLQLELLDEGWVNEPGPGKRRVGTLWSVLPEPEPWIGDVTTESPPPR